MLYSIQCCIYIYIYISVRVFVSFSSGPLRPCSVLRRPRRPSCAGRRALWASRVAAREGRLGACGVRGGQCGAGCPCGSWEGKGNLATWFADICRCVGKWTDIFLLEFIVKIFCMCCWGIEHLDTFGLWPWLMPLSSLEGTHFQTDLGVAENPMWIGSWQ